MRTERSRRPAAEALGEALSELATAEFSASRPLRTANPELMARAEAEVTRLVENAIETTAPGCRTDVEVVSTIHGRTGATVTTRITVDEDEYEHNFGCDLYPNTRGGVVRLYPGGLFRRITDDEVRAMVPGNRCTEASQPDQSGLVTIGYWTAVLIPIVGFLVGLMMATRPTVVARTAARIIVLSIVVACVWVVVFVAHERRAASQRAAHANCVLQATTRAEQHAC